MKKISFKEINFKKIGPFIIGGLIVVVIIFIITALFTNRDFKLKRYLKDMANNFYQEYYYPQVGDDDSGRINYVKNYSTIGFKMTLKGLLNYADSEKIKNSFDGCDLENTKVTVYPKAPYGINDYKLIVDLECE